ncbi:MAG: ATP-binding protein [Erysipelotrichaceae bacterium]|nr:ATP-binding protein [Erysipelotrichaceae bacterium]
MKKNRKRFISVLIVVISLATFVQYIFLNGLANEKRENKYQDTINHGMQVANTIQLTIGNLTEATSTLKYFYLDNEDTFVVKFDDLAASICADHPEIASMYIAPKAVIQAAYPEEVKASTIGFAMLEDEYQGPRAQLAIDTQKITIAGPHKLVEGGTGLIMRNPIFVDGEFKAFAIFVLDWDKCVEKILSNTDTSIGSYKYAVRKDTVDDTAVLDEDGYIFRNSNEKISNEVDITFEVPNDIWHLVVEPESGFSILSEMFMPICFSVAVAISIMILFVFWVYGIQKENKLQIEKAQNEEKSKYVDKLSDALTKAQKADAAKTTFLSRMSHDIRTPLNGIIGLLQINEAHADNRELVDRNRKKMIVSANHLLELINDVLEISKMDDDNVHLVKEAFDLNELIDDVLNINENKAIEAGIKLEIADYKNKIKYPSVMGSPLHVRQILINLFSNSIKYNKEKGSIFFDVDTKELENRQVEYTFTIKDTGIGMSEEFLSRIFEPFSQENSDEKSLTQGTGLGTAIVKSLVEKMNGHIEVESKQNIGSTFTVTIPFDLADENELNDKAVSDAVSLKGIRILLVEDNELNMEIAEMLLNDNEAIVTKAYNGEEAFKIFSDNPVNTFDLVLTDVMMPKMNGYELAKDIRNMDREDGKTMPIIAMTANAFEEDRQNSYAAGMNGHISKPFDIDNLIKTISNYTRV